MGSAPHALRFLLVGPETACAESGLKKLHTHTLTLPFLLVFALVAGIGFGGFRLIIKRLFPGKVFDRPHSVQIIQLGLSGKTIKGEDFY